MKKVLKIFGWLILVVLLLAGGFLTKVAITGIPKYAPGKIELKVEVTPERVARGKRYAQTLCSTCHMDPTTRKLTGKLMVDAPKEFGPIYSKNITKHPDKGIGAWTDGELAYLLRTGIRRDGQYLPPYMVKLPHISDEDLHSIIAFLRSDDPLVAAEAVDPPGVTKPSFLTKLLSHIAFKPLPYPTEKKVAPALTDKVAYGKYLSNALDCFPCHSADFKTMNVFDPEKTPGFFGGGNQVLDVNGNVVRSANLTPDDETGIGKWSEADFVRALRKGFRPDNTPLRYPMLPTPDLTDEEAGTIYAYLRTVPKIANKVDRGAPPALAANADEGNKIYHKYQCFTCHGETGVGVADLRKATTNYPTDEKLLAWIRNAPSIKPDTKMPQWEGVIPDAEFTPLLGYVKTLQLK
jgi:cytochrome c2